MAPRPTGGDGPVGPGAPPVVDGDATGGADGLSELEQALQKTGKADIYSIYFSFNSDAIREESEPTLKMVGALMRKHPEWRLTINGHTDNIASDKYNLDLSRRRAAAVVKALTTTYGVPAARLGFAGQGEFAPIDTNETLEGRAKNRRVELVRLP
jgi:outer membrane protein OmpA-like peptidoglycan-associated protein